ncbi:protein SOB FIVE-LIKE 1-like [Malania oleifera]|uniref:protein SOB FIVE-LIKE 1-like n=1 Tax=Malania oleifera TaxID=397392 RepID=UPI0025ADAB1E|nr:protein SOB FIVE-LIKE 1-like [Malania oleifera]
MESSQVLGVPEECSSSESGWTMYIGSPTHNYDYEGEDTNTEDGGGDDNNDKDNHSDNDDNNDDDESDDSMASDASSGPSHRELPHGSSAGKRGVDCFKHAGQDKNPKSSYGEKSQIQARQKTDERMAKAQKYKLGPEANSATSRVHSGAKVRKTK